MRKVAFPLQLDVLDLATDELREKLQPVNNTVKQILKARDERATIAKRSRGKGNALDGKKEEDDRRDEERKQIAALVAGSTEVGANPSGMYELCGEALQPF